MVQSTYLALLPPYTHFGVGRSNNYIESFNSVFSFAPKTDGAYSILMKTPIIPNSQLIVQASPRPADGWKVELFTNPDQSLYLILVGCGLVLVIIGIIIISLHASEKKIDKDKMQLPDF